MESSKLIVIVGQTASGKSALAMQIAEEFNGEIICADSRTIYKGLDIGTAKPTAKDQAKIQHWGLDLVELGQRFTVADFKQYTKDKIEDIKNRGKLPILVGGTGLYVDAVLYDFDFRPDADPSQREKLEAMSIEELQQIINDKSYSLPENNQNKRHLIRVIETQGQVSSKKPIRPDAIVVGLSLQGSTLQDRIAKRVDYIFDNGLEAETRALSEKYGKDFELNAGIAYKICKIMIDGEISKPEAKSLATATELRYAKRQKTWFKRNPDIKWFDNPQDAYHSIESVVD